MKKNELTEKTDFWKVLDQERVKMLKKHAIKKWNEGKRSVFRQNSS